MSIEICDTAGLRVMGAHASMSDDTAPLCFGSFASADITRRKPWWGWVYPGYAGLAYTTAFVVLVK